MSAEMTLPEEWINTQLGQVIDYGKCEKINPDELSSETWVLELEDIEKDSSKIIQTLTFSERKSKSTKNIFNAGNVLYGKLRPYLNKVVIAKRAGVCTTEIIPLDGGKYLHNNYLFHWLKHPLFTQYVTTVGYGVNMPRLGTKEGNEAPFVLAPLAEQHQIAQRLDELLAQVDTIKARLDAIPAILKRFRQSVLSAAVSGKLTLTKAELSDQEIISPLTIGPEIEAAPLDWKWRKLTDLAILESGHTPRKSVPEYWENGDIPWISLQDIREAHGKIIRDTKFKPNTKGIENSSARLLPAGTVCFSRDISVGFTTIMGISMSTTQHFANWICKPGLSNRYLMYCFMAAKDHLTSSGQGTTVKTIYMPALKELMILVPEINIQHQIVEKIELLLQFADKLDEQLKQAQSRVNLLTQSILAKAFRGELTADWRAEHPELISGENSAEALLAKIQAAKAALGGKKKSSKNS